VLSGIVSHPAPTNAEAQIDALKALRKIRLMTACSFQELSRTWGADAALSSNPAGMGRMQSTCRVK